MTRSAAVVRWKRSWDVQAEPLSDSTRWTIAARAACQEVARRSTATAVMVLSSPWISAWWLSWFSRHRTSTACTVEALTPVHAAMASGDSAFLPFRPSWHDRGMSRVRLSTTVDPQLLDGARAVRPGTTDASMVDEALRALLARHRSAEVDASYAVYDEHPLDESDEWGDLASWRRAVARS